jgi:hypothetical protein
MPIQATETIHGPRTAAMNLAMFEKLPGLLSHRRLSVQLSEHLWVNYARGIVQSFQSLFSSASKQLICLVWMQKGYIDFQGRIRMFKKSKSYLILVGPPVTYSVISKIL